MQKILSIVLASIIIIFTGLAVWLWFQAKDQKSELKTLRATIQQHIQKAQTLGKETDNILQKNQILQEKAQALKTSVQPVKDAAANQATDTSADEPQEASKMKGLYELSKKLMDDPEMKELMRQQIRNAFETQLEGLSEELSLTPEEKETLLNMLAENAENMSKAFLENSDPTKFDEDKMEQTSRQAEEQQQQFNQQLKTFLGEERFAKYEAYEKALPQRMEENKLKAHFVKAKMPLQDQQLQQLKQIVEEEAKSSASDFGLQGRIEDPTDLLNRRMQNQQEMYQRVVDRSSGFLTPDQQKSLSSYYQKEIGNRKVMLEMSKKFLDSQKTPETKPPSQ